MFALSYWHNFSIALWLLITSEFPVPEFARAETLLGEEGLCPLQLASGGLC